MSKVDVVTPSPPLRTFGARLCRVGEVASALGFLLLLASGAADWFARRRPEGPPEREQRVRWRLADLHSAERDASPCERDGGGTCHNHAHYNRVHGDNLFPECHRDAGAAPCSNPAHHWPISEAGEDLVAMMTQLRPLRPAESEVMKRILAASAPGITGE
ncbi:hypothetical protein F0U59_26715 [Archangium gephyra]|nr:hypothetical protein F0U59_26715 [Archangium gephyra]